MTVMDTFTATAVVALFMAVIGLSWRLQSKMQDISDKLSDKIDRTATELRADIQGVNDKIDRTAKDLRTDIQGVNEKVSEISERVARIEGPVPREYASQSS